VPGVEIRPRDWTPNRLAFRVLFDENTGAHDLHDEADFGDAVEPDTRNADVQTCPRRRSDCLRIRGKLGSNEGDIASIIRPNVFPEYFRELR
jgi:hypothetical protein